MPRSLSLAAALVCILPALTGCARPMEVIFFDDFSGVPDGGPPSDRWSAFSGHWVVKEGTLHQDAGGFDHGAVVRDMYLRCDYRMETKVRLAGGGSGAGLYWNVLDALTGETGNMLRYDGEFPIMYGWMRGRGFVGTGGATGDLKADGQWHTLRMDVHNSRGTFDVYWDGKKIVDDGMMYHRSGYAGLQCSLGHCEFDDFSISVPAGTDWRAAPEGKVTPEWIRSLAILPDGNIVYPVRNMHRVQVVAPDGRLVREFGRFGAAAGELNLPTAVAVGPGGQIYVTEAGNGRVQVFSADGRPLKLLAPSGEQALRNPFGVAVGADGAVWVADADAGRVVKLDAAGNVAAAVGSPGGAPGQLNKPAHLSLIDGKLYVADMGNRRIQVFDPANLAAAPQVVPVPFGHAPCSVTRDAAGNFFVPTWAGLQKFDASWKHLQTFFHDASGELWTWQVAFDKDGNILAADDWHHRIVVLAPSLVAVAPTVGNITTTGAEVTWQTDLPTPTRLRLLDVPVGAAIPDRTDYSKAEVVGDGALRTEHKVVLKGLKPSTRYTFAIDSPRRSIPDTGRSGNLRFATADAEGTMAYAEVPIAVLCYGHVTFASRTPPGGKEPEPAIRDEEWFRRNVAVHEAMREFYWRNSFFRLDTRCYYLHVKRPVEFAYLGSSSEEVYKDLAELARREGLKPTDFGAVLVIGGNCCYAYPYPTPWWGGKLTYTTGCCFAGGGDV